jgi:hypothetical protein
MKIMELPTVQITSTQESCPRTSTSLKTPNIPPLPSVSHNLFMLIATSNLTDLSGQLVFELLLLAATSSIDNTE